MLANPRNHFPYRLGFAEDLGFGFANVIGWRFDQIIEVELATLSDF